MDAFDPRAQTLAANDIIKIQKNCSHTLPVIGSKEFQPSHTLIESKQIEDALEKQADMLAKSKVDKLSSLSAASWDTDRQLALVTRRAGVNFEVMGHEVGSQLWLYAEEILLLLETSRAELWFGGVSMSIQQGYAVLLGKETGCRDIDYAVYKHLSHLGYKILRHKSCPLPMLSMPPTPYELAIRLEQSSAPARRKFSMEERDIKCVGKMPSALLEDDPAEAHTDRCQQEPSDMTPLETTDSSIASSLQSKETTKPPEKSSDCRNASRDMLPGESIKDVSEVRMDSCHHSDKVAPTTPLEVTCVPASTHSVCNKTPEALENSADCGNMLSDMLPSDFVVLDEWVAPDDLDVPANDTTASIADDDDDLEIIGVTLESKEITENSVEDKLITAHQPHVNEIPGPVSPKILAEICPEIQPKLPAITVMEADDDKVESSPAKAIVSCDSDANIFSDLNAFLAEICPSPGRTEDASPISAHESDFIAVSGVDTAQTVLNSLAEVGSRTADTAQTTDSTDDSEDESDRSLPPGFNLVIGQNACPVLLDVAEPESQHGAGFVARGKRQAEGTETAGPSKRPRPEQTQGQVVASAAEKPGDPAAGDVADEGPTCNNRINRPCVDASDSEESDDDCLDLSPGGRELESPVIVADEDSDLEIIEVSDVEELATGVSNKRKRPAEEAGSSKRRPPIEVINLSDETDSDETDGDETDSEETDGEDGEETEELDDDTLSVSSQPRPRFWRPELLEDEDRARILRSIVNVAGKTQVDVAADCRFVPPNCCPPDGRVKVFRLNAVGIGGKPSVDYVPAHQVLESRLLRPDFVPLSKPPPPTNPWMGAGLSYQPLSPAPWAQPGAGFSSQPPPSNPWVQVGTLGLQPDYQLTIRNESQQPPPPPWTHRPPPRLIAPGNLGYAIAGSFPPPPLLHFVRTPRMQNRTIRGVAKVTKPAMQQKHGWFQQNNVFSQPNALRVELPPPVKDEPSVQPRVYECKAEVKPNVFIKPEAGMMLEPGVWYDYAMDSVAIGRYTVGKILGICETPGSKIRIKPNQRKRLRLEWKRMLDGQAFHRGANEILTIIERKSKLYAGLTDSVRRAFGWGGEPAAAAPAATPAAAVKCEAGPACVLPASQAWIAGQVAAMVADCPRLAQFKPLQLERLKQALAVKARDPDWLQRGHKKILVYAARQIAAQAGDIAGGAPQPDEPMRVMDALVEWAKYLKIDNEFDPVLPTEQARVRFQIRSFPMNGCPMPPSAPSTGKLGPGPSKIDDVESLVAQIDRSVTFAEPMCSRWAGIKERLVTGNMLRKTDYQVLHFAHGKDPKLRVALPVLVNRSYMTKKVMPPAKLGARTTLEDCQKQLDELITICPWLNTFGERLDIIRIALGLIATGRNVFKKYKALLRGVSLIIIQTVEHILRLKELPLQRVWKKLHAMVDWANYLYLMKDKYSLPAHISALETGEGGPSDNTKPNVKAVNCSKVLRDCKRVSDIAADRMPAEQESSSEYSSEEADENAEKNVKEELSGDGGDDGSSSGDDADRFDDADGRTKLQELVDNIGEWLTLSDGQRRVWEHARQTVAHGLAVTSAHVKLFEFAAGSDERFRALENLTALGTEQSLQETQDAISNIHPVHPSVLEKINEMTVACPRLTNFTEKQLEVLGFALMQKEHDNNLSQEQKSVLLDVKEKIVEEALSILNDVGQPSSAVDALVDFANYVSLGEKLDRTMLVERVKARWLKDKREEEGRVFAEQNAAKESPDTCTSTESHEEIVQPLLKRSDCTDYASVISTLGIIKSANKELSSSDTTFEINFDLYLPAAANSAPFRKSEPGIPDYRLVVLRPEDKVPAARDLSALDVRCGDGVPVLFALVRASTVSFLRLGTVRLPTDLQLYGGDASS